MKVGSRSRIDQNITKSFSLLAQFDPIHLEEVDVRRESPQEVQDVVSTVIADDS